MPSTYYVNGDPLNYTIGGARLWFRELVSPPSTYAAWASLGNVVDAVASLETIGVQRYVATTGKTEEDDTLASVSQMRISFSLDELSEANTQLFFGGGSITSHTFVIGKKILRRGKATLRFVSDIGNEMELRLENAVLRSTADGLSYADDWSKLSMLLEARPMAGSSEPLGKIIHSGVGGSLADAAAPTW